MNALRKTAEQKVSSIASKQVAKPRRSKDQHAMAMLIQRRGRTSRTRLSGRGGPFSERRKLGWDYSGRSISLRAHRATAVCGRKRSGRTVLVVRRAFFAHFSVSPDKNRGLIL